MSIDFETLPTNTDFSLIVKYIYQKIIESNYLY